MTWRHNMALAGQGVQQVSRMIGSLDKRMRRLRPAARALHGMRPTLKLRGGLIAAHRRLEAALDLPMRATSSRLFQKPTASPAR